MTTDINSKKLDEVSNIIANFTTLEIVELVKLMEEKFGVSAAMPTLAAAVSTSTATGAAAVEEKTEFDLYLKEIGKNKVAVIKAVREMTDLGLKEAKESVESAQSAPKLIKGGLSKDIAESLKKKIEDAGAQAEIK